MATLVIDEDCNKEESVFMNIINDSLMNKHFSRWSYTSEEEEDQEILRKPLAPPPSPQQKPVLDLFFTEQQDPFVKHAKALNRILRKHQHCIYKKKPKHKSAFKHIKKPEDVLYIINELKEMGLHD